MALFWFAPLCVHDQITFVRSACGSGGSNFLWMKSHSRQWGGWWQRASFPPYDENHVSCITRAERDMVSGNTSGAASSPSLYLFHSLLPSISPFLLSPFIPPFFSFCACYPYEQLKAGHGDCEQALFWRRGEHVTTGLNTSVVLDTLKGPHCFPHLSV